MDVDGRPYYVAMAMEWLLILSAMLSAVTGAFSGARGEEARLQQTEAATALRTAVSVAEQVVKPVQALIPADAPPSTEAPAPADFALASAIPLYADRLIE